MIKIGMETVGLRFASKSSDLPESSTDGHDGKLHRRPFVPPLVVSSLPSLSLGQLVACLPIHRWCQSRRMVSLGRGSVILARSG